MTDRPATPSPAAPPPPAAFRAPGGPRRADAIGSAVEAWLRAEGRRTAANFDARPLPALDLTRMAGLDARLAAAGIASPTGWRTRLRAAWGRALGDAPHRSLLLNGTVGSLAVGAMVLAVVASTILRPVGEWRPHPSDPARAAAPLVAALRSGAAVETDAARGGVLQLDRATVYVAGASRLSVQGARRVRLEAGEAWFDVEAGRTPFTVSTPMGDLAVVGTRFGVTLEGDRLRVALEDGDVRLVTPTLARTIRPGEAVVVTRDSNELRFDLGGAEQPAWLRSARRLGLTS